jgi:catechol 2,3-dioxygenase-like lactoylglutathione lyase family enzyme
MTTRGSLGWPTWIGVVVQDLQAQRRFWGELLGLPEAGSGPDYVEFDMGQGRKFELLERSDEPQYDRPRFQVGFAVDDIEQAREEAIRRGAEPITEVIVGDESSWAYFRDPEGNVFEITRRP